MLSRFLLSFQEDDVRKAYKEEKRSYYKKALPIMTFTVLVLAVTMEVVFRADLNA